MMDHLELNYGSCEWLGDSLELRYTAFRPTRDEVYRLARLNRRLGHLQVPITALRDVELTPNTKDLNGLLRFLPRSGASPFHEAPGCDLHAGCDPLSFSFPPERELLVEYYATEICTAISAHGLSNVHSEDFMISVSRPLSRLVGTDGAIDIEDDTLVFTWGQQADPMKRQRRNSTHLPIAAVESLTWMDWEDHPDQIGYLQFRVNEDSGSRHPLVDPYSVILLEAEQLVDGLVFAATVLERLSSPRTLTLSVHQSNSEPSPSSSAMKQLGELGELRDRGIITEAEFQVKKRELLDRI